MGKSRLILRRVAECGVIRLHSVILSECVPIFSLVRSGFQAARPIGSVGWKEVGDYGKVTRPPYIQHHNKLTQV